MELAGRVALVTGGARRVGRAIVLELAAAGCDVAIHYRDSHLEAGETAEVIRQMGRRAVLIPGDLTDAASWPRIIDGTVSALGRLDVLVNNAAVFDAGAPDGLEQFNPRQWHAILQVNLLAPVGLSHFAAPHLKQHGLGKIVNLADIAAERPWTTHLAYCSSKAALVAVTKSLAKALAPNVQVNAVAPGIAEFPAEYTIAQQAALVSKVPLKRAGAPQDVARTVRFLVESGDYITGEIIAVDGGRSLV